MLLWFLVEKQGKKKRLSATNSIDTVLRRKESDSQSNKGRGVGQGDSKMRGRRDQQ